jgi:phosphoglycolate phosphatase-like HAD superfamily hydrolase
MERRDWRGYFASPGPAWVLCDKSIDAQQEGKWIKGKITATSQLPPGYKVDPLLRSDEVQVEVEVNVAGKSRKQRKKFVVPKDLNRVKPDDAWKPPKGMLVELGQEVEMFDEDEGKYCGAVVDQADAESVTVFFVEGLASGKTKTVKWTEWKQGQAGDRGLRLPMRREDSREDSRSVTDMLISSDEEVVASVPEPAVFRVPEVIDHPRPAVLHSGDDALVLCETSWNAQKAGTWLKGTVTKDPSGDSVEVELEEPLNPPADDGKKKKKKIPLQRSVVTVRCDLSYVKPASKWKPDISSAVWNSDWKLGTEVSYLHEGLKEGDGLKSFYNAVIDEADGLEVTIVFTEGPPGIIGTMKTLSLTGMDISEALNTLCDPVGPYEPPEATSNAASPPVSPPQSRKLQWLTKRLQVAEVPAWLWEQIASEKYVPEQLVRLKVSEATQLQPAVWSVGTVIEVSDGLASVKFTQPDEPERTMNNVPVKDPTKIMPFPVKEDSSAIVALRAELSQGSGLKLAIFDNDNTLTVKHVFKGLAFDVHRPVPPDMEVEDPHAKTELGQIRRIQMYDESYGDRAFATAAFGGPVRVAQIRDLLDFLKARGVVMIIITKGFVGPAKMCLRKLGLLDHFADVYGHVGVSNSYGATDYDRQQLLQPPSTDEAELLGKVYQDSWGAKAQLISWIMQMGNLQKSEVVFFEDDELEITSAGRHCTTVWVQDRAGIDESHISRVKEMCGEPTGQEPAEDWSNVKEYSGYEVGWEYVIQDAPDPSFNGKKVRIREFMPNNVFGAEMLEGGRWRNNQEVYAAGKLFKFPLSILSEARILPEAPARSRSQ